MHLHTCKYDFCHHQYWMQKVKLWKEYSNSIKINTGIIIVIFYTIQKEVRSTQKQLSCKKKYSPKSLGENRCEIKDGSQGMTTNC